ncbi:acyl-CoA thioesterase [Parapedomonas caeni]
MTDSPDIASVPETRLCDMVFPEQANHYGTLFGGAALNLMGKAAFIAASRHARAPVVMASADKVTFHHPVVVGQLVECHAWVSRSGCSSMTVEVSVICETLASGDRSPAMQGRFEMVRVDGQGRPCPIIRR